MKFSKDFKTLVIAGEWNRSILSPPWVTKYLLPNKDIKVEVSLNINSSLRFTSDIDSVIFGIDETGRFNFSSINKSDESFSLIEDLSSKIAEYLPHTPVTAFGINFVFEENPNDNLNAIFNFPDNQGFGEIGFNRKSASIKRQFDNNNRTLNLDIRMEKKCIFEFNFHFPISNLIDFKELIANNGILDLKKEALKIADNIYELTLEPNE